MLDKFFGLPANDNRDATTVLSGSTETKLDRQMGHLAADKHGQCGFLELPRGLDAFAARAVLARMAERSIDTQYYMWHQDIVGRGLIYELIRAADRGVRVRLLVDDMYGSDGQSTWLALDVHENIEVRLFAPYSRKQPKYLQFLTRFHDVNARMHTKTFTADNRATVLGGRNIGDEYFDADTQVAFADNDVVAIGPAVEDVSGNFDDYWNGGYAFPVATLLPAAGKKDLQALRDKETNFKERPEAQQYLKAVEDGKLANALRAGDIQFEWGRAAVYHDPWWKREQDREGWHDRLLISQLEPDILAAKEELIMVSPYFVPGAESTEAFCRIARNGVRVRILTNSLASNDVVAVHAGYSRYRKKLLRGGVELYELDEGIRKTEKKVFNWLPSLKKSSLHAKSMVIDRSKMFVGSFNYDQRSLYLNTEIGIEFEQGDIARRAAEHFDASIAKIAFRVSLPGEGSQLEWQGQSGGQPVRFRTEPYTGVGMRSVASLLRLLPLDWLL